MSRIKLLLCALVVSAFVFPAPAIGEIVHNTFGPGDSVSPTGFSYMETRPTGPGNQYRAATRIAAPFVLNSADTELKRVTVAINSLQNYRAAIKLQLWSDSSGRPGSVIATINNYFSYPNNTSGQGKDMRTSFDVPAGTFLTPRNKYWVVADMNLASYVPMSSYQWKDSPASSGDNMRAQYRTMDRRWDSWGTLTNTAAMRVEMVGNDAGQWMDPGDTDASAGDIDFEFSSIDGEGVLSVEPLNLNDMTPEETAAINFVAPTNPITLWNIDFDGTFTGPVSLTFNYDESSLLIPEEQLRIFHRNILGEWEMLPVIEHDMDANKLTVQTDSFSPFAMGSIPEPTTMSLLALGGLAMLRRRKR